jgi:hypothetical protein
MLSWLREIDRLIRGDLTRQPDPDQGQLRLPLRALITGTVILGASYGFFMGWFRAFGDQDQGRYLQAVSSMVKVPLLFALTLVVTLPSLYVFNALLGCRLSFASTIRLLMAAVAVSLAVAASFGPILAFFTVSTTSYPFIVILNVALLGVSGIVGLWFLLQTLQRLANASGEATIGDAAGPPSHAGQTRPDNPIGVFYFWILIFGIVGAQMGWLLRPFIGHPRATFQIFRERSGSFIGGLLQNLDQLVR